jgi:CheY-like chemotaxis protein
MMNGNIQVQSKKGEGTTFTVTVTLMDAKQPDSDEDFMVKPQEMSVLIIDDDEITGQHAKLVLEKMGVASEYVTSGKEAIEMVKLRQARRLPYNLILVDWQMPEMDGLETTRQIRDVVGHDSAIIILTAYRWDDILDDAVTAGIDSFIAKPLFPSALMEELQSVMKKKRLGAKAQKADLKGRRILLAEDVQINAEIMIMVLQAREMEVDHAENGKIAVDMFTSHPEGYYDAILMDMRMPEMDGLTATRTIRAMERTDSKEIPIIALTANAFDEDVQRSMQAGLNAHLSKPVEPDALYDTLESLIKP